LEGAKLEAQGTGIPLGPELPEGVEMAVREKAGKKIIFLLNYTEKTLAVAFEQAYKNALTGETEPAQVQIPAYDVKVLTLP
jgi:beta-galactosidase GanA